MSLPAGLSLISSLSHRATSAPESGIVEIINYARGRDNLLPLWAGEGDLPSPDFINRAASDALLGGETFYTWQRGIPELHQALSDYYRRHFSVSLPSEHFYVTGSGMQAIQLAVQAMTGPGDEMIYLSPAGPTSSPPSKSVAQRLSVWKSAMSMVPGSWISGRSKGDYAQNQGAVHQHAVQPDRLDGQPR